MSWIAIVFTACEYRLQKSQRVIQKHKKKKNKEEEDKKTSHKWKEVLIFMINIVIKNPIQFSYNQRFGSIE